MQKLIPLKEKQFEQVFDQNFSKIYNYVYYKLGNHTEAEDLTSDVFTRAYEHFADFDPARCSVYTWLRTIAHNAVVDYYRKNSRMAATLGSQAELEAMPSDLDVESNYLSKEEARHLLGLVRSLPEQQQELLSLKFFMGMNNREISRVTGLSESNVGTILHRIVRKLQKEM